jgi:hypothetical protein
MSPRPRGASSTSPSSVGPRLASPPPPPPPLALPPPSTSCDSVLDCARARAHHYTAAAPHPRMYVGAADCARVPASEGRPPRDETWVAPRVAHLVPPRRRGRRSVASWGISLRLHRGSPPRVSLSFEARRSSRRSCCWRLRPRSPNSPTFLQPDPTKSPYYLRCGQPLFAYGLSGGPRQI